MTRRTAITANTKQAAAEIAPARTDQKDEYDSDTAKGDENDTPLLEWVIACIGLLLVAGVLGLLLYKAIWGETSPPQITISVISIVPVQNGYLVQFQAVNQGGSTAEGVVVGGELRRDAKTAEASQTTLDYLPANSKKGGGLFFTHDPRQFDIQIRALGYEEP